MMTLIFNGISEGAHIFLMASSLSVILGLMRVVNFAHGALFLWGAYIFHSIFDITGSFPLGIVAAIVGCFLLGLVFEKVFISRVYGNIGAQIMITLGLQIVFTEIVRTLPFWGPSAHIVTRPEYLQGTTQFANGFILTHYRLFLIIVSVVIAALGHFILTRTRAGMTIRAGVQNSEMVGALGININRYFTMVFAVGAALAGLGGALFAPLINSVSPAIGMSQQLLAFIVVIIGGMGSFVGSMLGSIFLGIMVALVGWFWPDISLVAPVALMAIVLIFRPQGLFGLAVKK